ncbi:60S ribosomal protein L2, mitochondrial [Lactuca sativa]|uniref:60S ribosomal protein L2, mitochondrial n=1 Tax=Lactuca sativa TaxID=4236 RepID=UPI000CC3100A|nr:60S ribosomal protein L2, mitochondrial [Lactuca sativa]
MSFSSYCRRAVNGSVSLITSRISSSQMRSKHSISRAQNVSSERPLRQFVTGKDKSAGRNSKGRITIFHRGGGAKRSQRTIDLKRNTSSVGVVERIEYDPNRTSRIAVVRWVEGAAVDRPKKVNSLQKNFTPSPKILPSISIKGQFSFSSIPGMLEDKKVESLRPKTDHVVVGLGLSKGSRTLTSQSQSQTGTQMRNVKDVFLSAFSSSNGKRRHNAPYSFVNALGVPRMAVAGAKPEFFVPRMKDDVKENESLLLNEVKRWDKDSVVWGHKLKRKAAVSWGSLRQRGILGVVNESKSKSKVRESEKVKKDGKFGVDRAPVSYILATHQMEAGKMVMNCDLTTRSNDEFTY